MLVKQKIFIDMDDTIFDFTGAHTRALEDTPKQGFPQATFRFFADLEPLPGAIWAVTQLRMSDHFDPWIATAPSIRNLLCYTEKAESIARHFGLPMLNKTIIIPDKSLLIGDILIDDKANSHGQDKFRGEHIHFGTSDFPDWRSVIEYLEES